MRSLTPPEPLRLNARRSSRYGSIYWNLGWSHDGRSIAFKARNRDTGNDELAVADFDSRDGLKVVYTTTGNINADFTFSPDNSQVLFAMHSPEHKAPRLFVCEVEEPGAPRLLEGQPSDLRIFDCAWSSDDVITFAGQQLPVPTEWTGNGGTTR